MDIKPDYSLNQYLEREELELFHKKGEHYDLLSTLSQKYHSAKIYDIGTYKGLSAIALSSNHNNLVVSYDIGYFVKVKQPNNVEFRIGSFYNDIEMLKSPFIVFDIDPHDGIQEKLFVDRLININYKGTVLFDDIHLNDNMEQFWNSINQEKVDLTEYGHWSGTGIVNFN